MTHFLPDVSHYILWKQLKQLLENIVYSILIDVTSCKSFLVIKYGHEPLQQDEIPWATAVNKEPVPLSISHDLHSSRTRAWLEALFQGIKISITTNYTRNQLSRLGKTNGTRTKKPKVKTIKQHNNRKTLPSWYNCTVSVLSQRIIHCCNLAK